MSETDVDPPLLPTTYVFLSPGQRYPTMEHLAPYKAVVVVDADVESGWQIATSEWLVQTGCRYMMAWGQDCSSWDDTVDRANIVAFAGRDIPDDQFVMTTWHEKESLSEAFWFSKYCATHPAVDLKHTVLLHIALNSEAARLSKLYEKV